MGLILDTTVLINAERAETTAVQIAWRLSEQYRTEFFALSVISLTELARGRGKLETHAAADRRQHFLEQVRKHFTLLDLTPNIAVRAGLLSAELSREGFAIGLADTLIAATAMKVGFGVLTHNTKHFQLVTGLQVVAA